MRRAAVIAVAALVAVASFRSKVYAGDPKLAFLLPLSLYGPEGLVVDSDALLPNGQSHAAHFNSSFQAQFAQTSIALNSALAGGLAALAAPSPASGFTYTFNPSAGVFTRSTESYGPVLGERAETIGRHMISTAIVYQHFNFDRVGDLDLDDLPYVFSHDNPALGGRADVIVAPLSLSLVQDQTTLLVDWGAAATLDLAIAVPVVRTELQALARAQILRLGTESNPQVHYFLGPLGEIGLTRDYRASGSATGLGDVLLRAKKSLKRAQGGQGAGLALGFEVRLPTGDEENLLGAGALGLRPLLIASLSRGRFAAHVNASYQWNGDSVLAGNIVIPEKASLPDIARYSAGVDVGASRQATFSLDLLGTHSIDAVRLSRSTYMALDGVTQFPSLNFAAGSTSAIDLALGGKFNVGGKLLLDASALWSLKNTGLRDRFVTMLALEYSF